MCGSLYLTDSGALIWRIFVYVGDMCTFYNKPNLEMTRNDTQDNKIWLHGLPTPVINDLMCTYDKVDKAGCLDYVNWG